MNIIRIESIDSTNAYLKELAHKQTLEEGTVIVTHNQTAGRGQRTNPWDSEAGKNITCSILLYPTFLPVQKHFLLSKAISVGVKDTLDAYTGEITIKWPNDIYWKENKIAGILIENELTGNELTLSIVGIGININQERFSAYPRNPVSLKQITGKEQDLEILLKELIKNVLHRYEQLKNGDTETISGIYNESLFRKTGFHHYEDSLGIFNARIDYVSDDGLLHLISDLDEEFEFSFQSVRFVTDKKHSPLSYL